MIKFAPLITIYDFEDSEDLQREVIWTFSSFLKGVSTIRHRFNIHVVQNINEESQRLDGSVKSVSKYFPIQAYVDATKNARRQLLLELIVDCFLEVSKELEWSEKRILEAKENCLRQGIQFQYLTKPIKNKVTGDRAQIELSLKKDKVSIWVVFSQKNNDSVRKHLIDTHANQVSFFRSFDHPKWMNNSYFGFEFNNRVTLSVAADNDEVVWKGIDTKKEESFRKQIDYQEELSPEEMLKLTNW